MKRRTRKQASRVLPEKHCSQDVAIDPWIPLAEIVDVLHHPCFYWGALGGFTNCKYLELRIDTRDNSALVRDRNGNSVDWQALKASLDQPIMREMNSNPRLALLPVPEPAPAPTLKEASPCAAQFHFYDDPEGICDKCGHYKVHHAGCI